MGAQPCNPGSWGFLVMGALLGGAAAPWPPGRVSGFGGGPDAERNRWTWPEGLLPGLGDGVWVCPPNVPHLVPHWSPTPRGQNPYRERNLSLSLSLMGDASPLFSATGVIHRITAQKKQKRGVPRPPVPQHPQIYSSAVDLLGGRPPSPSPSPRFPVPQGTAALLVLPTRETRPVRPCPPA